MNPEPDTQKFDLRSPETLGELEKHVQRQLNGRVRAFGLSMRDDGLILEGHTHMAGPPEGFNDSNGTCC